MFIPKGDIQSVQALAEFSNRAGAAGYTLASTEAYPNITQPDQQTVQGVLLQMGGQLEPSHVNGATAGSPRGAARNLRLRWAIWPMPTVAKQRQVGG